MRTIVNNVITKNKLKRYIDSTIGVDKILWILRHKDLAFNFWCDLKLYYIHSNVFRVENIKKIEAKIILDYHSVEKGLLFKERRFGFAESRIVNLIKNLTKEEVILNRNRSQFLVAYKIMCEYYELHKENDHDISAYYSQKYYEFFKNVLQDRYDKNFKGVINFNRETFYENRNDSFASFSDSRKSVRNFTGEIIAESEILKAISICRNTPSVCNRQGSKIYYIDNKDKIGKILKVQGGFTGYTENVRQLLILTSDRNYFYTVGERNQLYIDGGLFLMNLLYALHFHKIANCPANWGKTIKEERKLEGIVEIPKSEKIICLIPIGKAEEEFRVTLSQRRDINEVYYKLN